MREIKFRAVQKLNNGKKFLTYPFSLNQIYIDSEDGYYYCDGKYNKEVIIDDDTELMQFTGLKDKDGKEIYEGDIVKYNKFDIDNSPFIYGIVIFEDGIYWVDGDSDIEEACYKTTLINCFNHNAEIIGNIYEAKERKK
jgi:uncharacterized phage protein (TIGR01671 family)